MVWYGFNVGKSLQHPMRNNLELLSPMQCIEHIVAQRIADFRVQSPEIASLYLL